jgi:ArsR family transcriptional regulator, arsenate/arsenite/antimonite-responsive transcriptional repressor
MIVELSKSNPAVTELFRALNDDTRRAILDLLRKRDLSAGDIAEHFHLGKPTISHHLDLLKRAGLVTTEKQGQFVIYSLSTSVLEDALRWMLDLTQPKPKTKHP